MTAFQSVDFLQLDALLGDEAQLVRRNIREFVSREFLPVLQTHIRRDGSFPLELVPAMAQLGLFGANLHGYGCAGMSHIAYGLMMQELERGDSGLRSFVSVQGALVMHPILHFGSTLQKETWLPRLARGEAIGCFGLTEPDFGSDPGGMLTRAERRGETWILNGTKRWITNGSIADIALIWAKTSDGVRAFLVPKGRAGFATHDIHGKLSLRASITSELVLQDVHVAESERLPEANGLKTALQCLNQARYGIAWGALGAAMACYDEVVNYTKERKVQGGLLAEKQLVQEKLAFMLTEITKAQLLALRIGQLKEQNRLAPAMISLAKRNNVDMALQIARLARDLLGANGIVDDYASMRHMLNLETVRTYEGTHDIHTLILGEYITGKRAY